MLIRCKILRFRDVDLVSDRVLSALQVSCHGNAGLAVMEMWVSCHAECRLAVMPMLVWLSHFLLLTPVTPSKISSPMRLPPACPQHAQHAWGHELGWTRHAAACPSQFIFLFQILIYSLDFERSVL